MSGRVANRRKVRDRSGFVVVRATPMQYEEFIARVHALVDRITDLVTRKQLTNGGPYVAEFEEKIAALAGVQHCVAVSSATAGLPKIVQKKVKCGA